MAENLLNFDAQQLTAWFAEQGEKPFRARQVLRWIHKMGEPDFAAMTDIAASLREKLQQQACVTAPVVQREELSTDGTRKWLLNVGTGNAPRPCTYLKLSAAPCAFPPRPAVRWTVPSVPPASRALTAT
jgi:adenine C2-methylase RlmN of 23S rRNA A2503 and tRNA A37